MGICVKKANLKSHYSSKHAKLGELRGQMCLDKALWWSLEAQQAAFTRPHCDRDSVM